MGPYGRTALIGLGLSAVVAILVAFLIPASVRRSLLATEMAVLEEVVADAQEVGAIRLPLQDPGSREELEHLVEHRLMTGRTVRVKVLDTSGRIVYSDDPDLIDRSFPLSEPARMVLAGEPSAITLDRDEPENVGEIGLGPLIEFILPIADESGEVVGLFEFYQSSARLEGEVSDLRRTVWLAIGAALGLSLLFTTSLTMATGRAALRRHRQAEHLLEGMLNAEEEERRRVVGALHNDIGQPLYRILFGLQSTRMRLGEGHPQSAELEGLEELTRGMDTTLRAEFNALYEPATVGLEGAIDDLATSVMLETDLAFGYEIEIPGDPPIARRDVILRAAEEAVTNVRKHAHAGSVWLKVSVDGQRLTLTVEDDGVGTAGPEGIGLLTMRERLESIGGGLKVRSRSSVGTLVTAWVPYDSEVNS